MSEAKLVARCSAHPRYTGKHFNKGFCDACEAVRRNFCLKNEACILWPGDIAPEEFQMKPTQAVPGGGTMTPPEMLTFWRRALAKMGVRP
jgi:hypothetical protein